MDNELLKYAKDLGIEIHFVSSSADIDKLVQNSVDVGNIQYILKHKGKKSLKLAVLELSKRGQMYAIKVLKDAGWDLSKAKEYVCNL